MHDTVYGQNNGIEEMDDGSVDNDEVVDIEDLGFLDDNQADDNLHLYDVHLELEAYQKQYAEEMRNAVKKHHEDNSPELQGDKPNPQKSDAIKGNLPTSHARALPNDSVLNDYDLLLPRSTMGFGDCPIHAVFGEWNDSPKQFICDDVNEKRTAIANAIRHCKNDSSWFPLICEAIQALVMGGERIQTSAIVKAQISWAKYCLLEPETVENAWNIFEIELTKYPAITGHISHFFEEYVKKQRNEKITDCSYYYRLNFKNIFGICLNEDGGVLHSVIHTEPELLNAYIIYNAACSQKFNWQAIYTQGEVIREYAAFIEKPGNWLLPVEIEMISMIFDISINYYIKNPSTKNANSSMLQLHRTCNPGKANTVSVYFNGRDHYEKMATQKELDLPFMRPRQNNFARQRPNVGPFRRPTYGMPLSIPQQVSGQTKQHDALEINKDKHIFSVSFKLGSQKTIDRDVPPIFSKARKWKNIPRFAIVTGVNGSGKSRLLDYIYANIEENNPRHKTREFNNEALDLLKNEVIYIKISDNLDNLSSGDPRKDNSFIINDKFNEVMDELYTYFTSKSDVPLSELAKPIHDQILREISAGYIKREHVDKFYLRGAIYRTINYQANDLRISAPFAFLTYIMTEFERRKNALRTKAFQLTYAIDLFKFYDALSDNDIEALHKNFPWLNRAKLPLANFLEQIAADKNFREMVIDHFASQKAGASPIQEINKILIKYNFKYTVDILKSEQHQREIQIIFKRGSLTVKPTDLSSGERLIICMMVWQFYAQGMRSDNDVGVRQLDNKTKVMLLDEPDRHLDPKLCKLFYKIIYEEFIMQQNIQVIMTTHRFDTVSLAPEGTVYLIRHEPHASMITPTTKLHAMFRMSRNIRELLDYHHKVYTESARDARFYEGVYHSLKETCDLIREKQSTALNRNHNWILDINGQPPVSKRLLSDRYQMSFYSVSEKDKKGNKNDAGGCTKVISSIKRDLTALENLSAGKEIHGDQVAKKWQRTRNIFIDKRLYFPLGVLDNDYGKDYQLDREGIRELAVVLSRRHSVENYLFDPIIFCSLLAENEIQDCIQKSKINFGDKIESERKNETLFLSACFMIKNILSRNDYAQLQPYLNNYFQIMFKTILKNYKYRPNNKQKPEEVPIYNNLRNKIQQNLPLCDTAVTFIDTNSNVFILHYPQEFLSLRGHDIEEFFWYEFNDAKPGELAATKVHEDELRFIPLDLADIFFELNDKIRATVLPVIKPDLLTLTTKPTFFSGSVVRSKSCDDLAGVVKHKENENSKATNTLKRSL